MEFSRDELMAVCTAREIGDGQVVFIGTGLPMVGAYLAKATTAPHAVLMFESGVIDSAPSELAQGVGDFRLMSAAHRSSDLFDTLTLLHGGHVDLGVLGCAQIDSFGNINTTVIGSYEHPKVRLPGSGGANDIASLARDFLVVARQDTRRFVKRLDYLTTPGYLDGPYGRLTAGLPGNGPRAVITDLAVLDFDDASRRMRVRSIHPGITRDDLSVNTGFELLMPASVPMTTPPSELELTLLRTRIDPGGVYVKPPQVGKES